MDGSASPAGLVVAACAQIISDLHKCCCSPASAPPPLTNRQDRRRRKATASGVLEGQPQTYPSPGTRSLQPDSSCAPVLLLPPPSQPGAQQQHLPLGNHSGEQHTVVVKDVTQGAILADPAQPKQGHCYEEAAAGHAPVSVIDIMVAELQQKHGCQGMQSCPGGREVNWLLGPGKHICTNICLDHKHSYVYACKGSAVKRSASSSCHEHCVHVLLHKHSCAPRHTRAHIKTHTLTRETHTHTHMHAHTRTHATHTHTHTHKLACTSSHMAHGCLCLYHT